MGRISMIDSSPGMGSGQRRTHASASSMDLTCHSQKPAMSSLVSAKGPSITRRSPFRADHALALRARLKAVAGQQHPGLHQLVVAPAHLLEELGIALGCPGVTGEDAGLGVRSGLDDHHDAHRFAPWVGAWSLDPGL